MGKSNFIFIKVYHLIFNNFFYFLTYFRNPEPHGSAFVFKAGSDPDPHKVNADLKH
jgi:hypothetical protein